MKARHIGQYHVNYDDGTCWPRLGTDLNWRARYDTNDPPSLLSLAEVVGAFEVLCLLPQRRRNEVIRALRENAVVETADLPQPEVKR